MTSIPIEASNLKALSNRCAFEGRGYGKSVQLVSCEAGSMYVAFTAECFELLGSLVLDVFPHIPVGL